MRLDKFLLNGKVLPIEDATVSVLNIEYQYGYGVYETVRVNNNVPFFLDHHIKRLVGSAKTIGLDYNFSEQDFKDWATELVKQLNAGTYNLKFLLIGGDKNENALFYIFASSPLFPDKSLLKKGVSVITTGFERVFPTAKTLNMLQSYLAYKKAKESGCWDAIGIDRDGVLREGTRTNFFAIKGNVIYKAPKEKILDGITQQVVLSVAAKNGFQIQEHDIKKTDLNSFDGFFLTSTGLKVVPISKIDDVVFTIPESVRKLMSTVNDFFDKCYGVFEQ